MGNSLGRRADPEFKTQRLKDAVGHVEYYFTSERYEVYLAKTV